MGGLFGGGGKTMSRTDPVAAGLRVQTSAYGLVIPKVYGRTRIAGNLIWYGDFTAIPHTEQSSGGGKGGGGGGSSYTSWTYTASFLLALAEGPGTAINAAWRDKDYLPNATQTTSRTFSATATESFVVPGSPYKVTVANSSQWSQDLGIVAQETYAPFGGLVEESVALVAGYDYTITGGVYTFRSGLAGRAIKISYSYTGSASVPPLLTPFLGTYPQTTWSNLTSRHPAEAISYQGVMMVAATDYDLGSDAGIQNHSFDVTGCLPFNVASGIYDANPKDILIDYLSGAHSGAGFPASKFGDLTTYSNYCVASGIFLSPAYTEQQPAHEGVTALMRLTNSGIYFSEGKLKVVPFGDTAITGNGVTYTPPAAPIYDLGDDDFIVDGDSDPVRVPRGRPADAYNQVQVEFVNRSNQYNAEPAEAKDQAAIDDCGLRPLEPIKAHEIADPAVARQVAQLILQRKLFIRNTYEFQLGWKHCLLEPTDIITITDVALGLDKYPVRIISIEENEDGVLSVQAEDYPAGISHAAIYPSATGAGYAADYNTAPGDITPPAFLEAQVYATTTGLAVGVAVTGVAAAWGGCDVHVSYDGNTYRRVGRVNGGARYGWTTNDVTAAVGQSAGVVLTGKGGQLLSGSPADAENKATLCLIGDEYCAHGVATLAGTNAYSLALDARGAYSTVAAAHAAGARFVRVDDAIVWSESLPLEMIGKTIYFKFVSFNAYGGGFQTVDAVQAYPYTIAGTMAQLPPADVTGFTAVRSGAQIRLSWNPVAEPDLGGYRIKRGASWDAGILEEEARATYLVVEAQFGTVRYWIKAIDSLGNESASAAYVDVTWSAPATVPWFAISGSTLTWGAVADVAGYRIKFAAGYDTAWDSAQLAHDGLVLSPPFVVARLPSGPGTLLVKAVDVGGQESPDAAAIHLNFGDEAVENVIATTDFKALGWPGTVFAGALSGGNLVGQSGTSMYRPEDDAPMYMPDSAMPMFDDQYGPVEYQTDSTAIVGPLPAGSRITISVAGTSDGRQISYRLVDHMPFYSQGTDDPFYGADGSPAFGGFTDWIPWPGALEVPFACQIQFLVTLPAGRVQPQLTGFSAIVDVPDIVEELANVAISAAGTRLPITQSYRAITNVQLTLESDGGTAVTVKYLDKSTAGPLVQCFNAAGAAVSGTIDATIKGY